MAKLRTLPPLVGSLAPKLGYARSDPKATGRYRRANQPSKAWYNTAWWKKTRLRILVRDLFTCQKCGVLVGGRGEAHVDHIEPHNEDRERFFCGDDALQTLCATCHASAKRRGEKRPHRQEKVMEAALRGLLVGSGPVAALVGTRVYWGEIPQGSAPPSIVMYVISRVPGYTFQGRDGMDESRIQIDVRDTNLGRAWQVRDAIRSRLSGYRGTISGTYVSGAFLLSERQRRADTGPELFHTVSLDFQIWSRAAS